MEYIDKYKLNAAGEAIVNEFLKRIAAVHPYPTDLYELFKSDRDANGKYSKEKLIELLLEEQNGLCCYCMRELKQNPGEVTLEHIILNSIKQRTEYNQYLNRENVLTSKVVLSTEFIEDSKRTVPPYPHTVAYENLAASCNGTYFSSSEKPHCCNLKRGSLFVEPIILSPSVGEEIEYKVNGFAIWKNERELSIPLMNKLGLNDNLLRMIRRIWFYIKEKQIDVDQTTREKILYSMLESLTEKELSDTNTFNLLYSFKNDTYWNLLLKYRYFGNL